MIDWLLVISLFLHLVATVIWLGGLVLASTLVWQEARLRIDSVPGLVGFLDRLRAGFNPLANLSVVVLITTGLYQMARNPNYQGLLIIDNDWSRAMFAKHLAVIGMIVIGGIMQYAVIPAIERSNLYASKGKPLAGMNLDMLRRRERQLIMLNSALGMVVLLCTAVATAL